MEKAVKQLENSSYIFRRVKITADHGTQTTPEGRHNAQAERVMTKTANPDTECQTPCWWEMQGPFSNKQKLKLQQAQKLKRKCKEEDLGRKSNDSTRTIKWRIGY